MSLCPFQMCDHDEPAYPAGECRNTQCPSNQLRAIPADVRRILTAICTCAADNPNTAERRRIGTWLGIPRHQMVW